MGDPIYLLNFRDGTVEEISETVPPRGLRDAVAPSEPEDLPEGAGFVLAALGTPPGREDDE